MSDVAKWVRGPVQTLRSEFATWDLERQEWKFDRPVTEATFRPDGAILSSDTYNPDGSIAHSRFLSDDAGRVSETGSWMNDGPVSKVRYFYDETGRPTRTARLNEDGTQTDLEVWTYDVRGRKSKLRCLAPRAPGSECNAGTCIANVSYAIEGTDSSYGASGASTLTIDYDEHDRPVKVSFHDADHRLLSHVLFRRDSTGKLLSEERHEGETGLFQEHLNNTPPERRAQLAAMLKQVFSEGLSATRYSYDEQGRLITRESRLGTLGGTRSTYRYNDRNDHIEQTTEHRSCEGGLDEAGNVQYSSEKTNIQHNRLEYLYDAHGNWTEKMVSYRLESGSEFRRSSMQRRIITYYAM